MDEGLIQVIARRTAGLFHTVPKQDVEDLRQEVWLALWEKREKIGQDTGLAYKIGKDAAIDWLRREHRYHEKVVLATELPVMGAGVNATETGGGGSAVAPVGDLDKARLRLVELL